MVRNDFIMGFYRKLRPEHCFGENGDNIGMGETKKRMSLAAKVGRSCVLFKLSETHVLRELFELSRIGKPQMVPPTFAVFRE
ncbi:hypothetical protein GEV33_001375 [Tenebrio molitor]|jgi:hypothetical protein|uniref:Uncharacterized protein n=1 Tax=Tenebrio molitor TaxID=7067 RepID=A0A8J6HT92_TENMO|nr:hypothetical protein GEV33_001375 [Tenebrio molitor]